MTRQQALDKLLRAEGYLKNTTAGYSPTGPWWKRGMPLLWEVRKALPDPNGQMLAEAHGILRLTEKGYKVNPNGPNWKAALKLIDAVEADLFVPPIPALGPALRDHKSVLLYVPTHNTDGFDGVWPAFDDTIVRVGSIVIAPEACRVIDHTGSDGGVGFKVRGDSGIIWLFLHCAVRPNKGARFGKGEKLSSIARIRPDQGGPHLHLGCDTRPLIGMWLLYGGQRKPSDRPRDYTYGSPTIGKQLASALAA